MSDDDLIGRILSRREVLALFGASGAAALAACAPGTIVATPAPATTATPGAGAAAPSGAGVVVATPSCIVRPALTDGPFFVDEKLDRSDIRSDPETGAVSAGVTLTLAFNVARIASGVCTALPGALVDVWHCDAFGVYSDTGGAAGQKFLRGSQRTDANGQARFTTVYPGWYPGRAVHVHFKIRTLAANGSVSDFTSQLFFDETVNDQVLIRDPYAKRPATLRLRNSGDGIYRGGGDQLLVKPVPSGAGYAVTFDVGLAR